MLKLVCFFILLFSLASMADDKLTVYTNCDGGKDISSVGTATGSKAMSAEDLVKALKTSGMKSTSLDSKVSCGTSNKVDMMGMSQPFQTSNFSKVTFSTNEIYYYTQKQELLYKNNKRSTPPPSDLAGVLKEFSMNTAGNCDFLVPSRFSVMKTSDLKPKSANSSDKSQPGIQ